MSIQGKYMASGNDVIRHNWTTEEVLDLMEMPFADLVFLAQTIFRKYFDPNEVQVSSLLSIKTGSCSEDCAYCPQSAHFETGVKKEELLSIDEVVNAAMAAKEQGAGRFCMGAAWRSPKDKDIDRVCQIVEAVKSLNMETCMTLGMLSEHQAARLKDSGLDYYNHNLDTSEEYYSEIISTRTYQDRLDTLERVRGAGLNVCCGGIVGMGEGAKDRAGLLTQLANLPKHPESVPINMLVQVEGTPLAHASKVDPIVFVRMVAAARIMMPRARVRLSAGRTDMSDETQALCFLVGANSIFYGERLLTTDNPIADHDKELFRRLGLKMAGIYADAQ
jgi:biotin synthase